MQTNSPKQGDGVFGAGVIIDAVSAYKQKFVDYLKGLNQIEHASEAAGHRIEQKLGVVVGNAFQEIMERAQGYLDRISKWGEHILGVAKSFVMETVHAAAEFDDIGKQMELAFGDKAQDVFERTEEAADNAGFAFKDAADFVTAMGKQGVNALDHVKNKAGEAITVLEALDDLSAFSKMDLGGMEKSLRRAAGEGKKAEKSLGRLFAHAPLESWEKSFIRAGNTMQEKINRIAQLAQDKFGGMSDITDMAFNELSSNIESTIHDLKAKLGKPLQDAIVPVLSEIWKFLKELKKNKELFEALGEIWKEIGKQVAVVAKYGFILARWIVDFVTKHRELAKQLAIWIGYAVSFVTLAAGILSGVVGVSLFVASIKLLIPTILSAAAAIGTVLLYVGLLTAAGYVLYTAYKSNWGGFRELIDGIYWGIVGLVEVIRNWTDGTSEMSQETSQNLRKAGIFEWVVSVSGWLASLWDAFKRVFTYLGEQWPRVVLIFSKYAAPLHRLFDAVKNLLFEVTDALGLTSGGLDGTTRSVELAKTAFEYFLRALQFAAEVGAFVINVIAQLINEIRYAGRVIRFVVTGEMTDSFNQLSDAGQLIAFMFRGVYFVFANVLKILLGIGQAIYYVVDAMIKMNGTWNPKKWYDIMKDTRGKIGAIEWTTTQPFEQTVSPSKGAMETTPSASMVGSTTAAVAASSRENPSSSAPSTIALLNSSAVDELKEMRKDLKTNKIDEQKLGSAIAGALEDERLRRHGETGGRGY